MKQFFTILSIILLFAVNTNAQLFQNTIGKPDVIEHGGSIAQLPDSSYMIAGDFTTNFFSTQPLFITHLKKNGSVDWSKKIVVDNSIFLPTSFAEAIKTASSRPNGYVMLINETDIFYVVRLSNAGTVTWARKFEYGASASKIKPVYDNTGTLTGFMIIAVRDGIQNPMAGATVMKIGTTGNTIWQRRIVYNTEGSRYRFADMQVTADGGCIAAGNLIQNYDESFPVLFRLTSTGVVVWGYAYIFTANGDLSPEIKGVTITNTGYAVTGSDQGGKNITFSTSSSGAINWAYKYSNNVSPYQDAPGSSIVADAAGNLIVACEPGSNGAPIFKLSPAGVVLFAKRFNNTSAFNDIRLTNKGTYCAVGYAGPYNDADISVVNISSTGTIKSGCQPTNLKLTRTTTYTKLLGHPYYSTVNETITNTAVTLKTTDIQTQQALCNNLQVADDLPVETSSNKLLLANDVAGQRVVIKWQTHKDDYSVYQAILYNQFGQPVTTISLSANQTAYMPMNKMQTGIYSVWLKQNSKVVARDKVVWVK